MITPGFTSQLFQIVFEEVLRKSGQKNTKVKAKPLSVNVNKNTDRMYNVVFNIPINVISSYYYYYYYYY